MTAELRRIAMRKKKTASTSVFEINRPFFSKVWSWFNDIFPSINAYYQHYSEGFFSGSMDDDKPPLRAELFSAEQMEQH